MTTTVVETCRIPPPSDVVDELTLPLSQFDIIWLHYHPIRRLLFYEFSACSKPYFLETIVPKLKHSLSLTLKHYLPVSGNLIYPSSIDKKPVIRYVAGDSVLLTIAESSIDFDNLIGDHARDADQFYDFVPQIPPVIDETDYQMVPVIALQVTSFPGHGICIGFSNLHCLGDGSSIVRFISAWGSITKFGGEKEFSIEKGESLPIFDRSVIKDPLGIDSIYWKVMGMAPLKSSAFPLPTNRVRATFILNQAEIKRLKDLVLAKKPELGQVVSSFVVTMSYVWSCLTKSGDAVGVEADGNVFEHFIFTVDARSRMSPPVPGNYFGNCLGYAMAKVEHEKLVGDEGFVVGAEALAEEIMNKVNKKGELLKDSENLLSKADQFEGIKALGVSGSPRFDICSADFGWGKARKLEVLSIDEEYYSVSLCKSGDSEGGLEVGLSLPKHRMEAFASVFADGLNLLH